MTFDLTTAARSALARVLAARWQIHARRRLSAPLLATVSVLLGSGCLLLQAAPLSSKPEVLVATETGRSAVKLTGTWTYVGNNASEMSAYELDADGRYDFHARFSMGRVITIAERGRYGVEGNIMILRPQHKVYNGEFTAPGPTRSFSWQIEPDTIRGGRLLILTPFPGGIPSPYRSQ
jgi:hypothetical protein